MREFFNKLLEDVQQYQIQAQAKGFKVVGIILNREMIEILKSKCQTKCEGDLSREYRHIGHFYGIPVIEMEGSYKIRYIIESEEGL